MSAARWEPLKELMTLRERMNRLFEESLTGGPQEREAGVWSPLVDIMEKGEEIIIKMEITEVNQGDIDIKMEGEVLSIKGERKIEEGTKREDYYKVERPYGSFSRSFNIPGTVDPGKVMASYKDGVLRITLTKKEETNPRQITVEVEE